MKKHFILLIVWVFSIFATAQIPSGYYNGVEGKKKAELKTAFHQIIKQASVLSYGGGNGKTWSGFAVTDVRSDGMVWDMYSNLNYSFNGNLAVTGMNIEHSFPKSWWGGTETQAYKDLHHLNPSDATANQRKSSYMMSVVDTVLTYTNNVIKVGKTKKKAGMVVPAWEPADEYKGDFARVYMYMVTAYQDYAALWTGDSEHQLDNNTYPVFEPWAVDLLLQWSRQDPVSEKEINRNNAVYQIQGNRNPFIDFPQLSEYIWGNLTYLPFTANGIVDFPYLKFPDNKDTVLLDKIYYQQTKSYSIPLHAANLSGDLTVSLSGEHAGAFSLPKTSYSQSEAESGTNILVDFSAINIGEQNVQLNISGGGIQPVAVCLKAYSSDEFVALSAENVTSTGFDASWTVSVGANQYDLNVFTLQPNGIIIPKLKLEEGFAEALPNTWIREGWTDNTLAGNIKLGSGSNYGKIIFPALDMSGSAFRLTVSAKQYNTDNGAKLTAALDNKSIAVWTTATAYNTFSVDVPAASTASVFNLSTASGKRVYIDYLKVEALIPQYDTISVTGFPANAGLSLVYSVTALLKNTDYYYNVSTNNGSETTSNVVKVHTLGVTTSDENSLFQVLKVEKTTSGILLKNLSSGSVIYVYNAIGQCIQSAKFFQSEIHLLLPRGFHIIRVIDLCGLTQEVKVIL